jgi:integrase/recombinase XerD
VSRISKKTVKARPAAVPDSPLQALMTEYLDWLGAQNYTAATILTFRISIGYFLDWCRERALDTPQEITRPVLERYQRALYHYRKKNGEPLTFRSQNTRLRPLKGWFRWMARQNHILHNPASELMLPRLENRLPKHILNVAEVERVLSQADVREVKGLRDRALMELLYATGMRRMELAGLKLYDVDHERGTVMIRQGKGRKDRHVPAGERALGWLRKYIGEARPELLGGREDGTVFLNNMGAPFELWQVTHLVGGYVRKADVGKTGSCHLFRHTVATLMLENGADVRVIQELLGHARLDTTQLYTRVSINLLKRVHAATHPGVELVRSSAAAAERNAEAEAELFSVLAAEVAEEG